MNDVFISYAHIDDQPLTEGQRGWISQFHRSLEVRMAQLLGEELKIWRDPTCRAAICSMTRSSSNSPIPRCSFPF